MSSRVIPSVGEPLACSHPRSGQGPDRVWSAMVDINRADLDADLRDTLEQVERVSRIAGRYRSKRGFRGQDDVGGLPGQFRHDLQSESEVISGPDDELAGVARVGPGQADTGENSLGALQGLGVEQGGGWLRVAVLALLADRQPGSARV
jgi:hypothetical protein